MIINYNPDIKHTYWSMMDKLYNDSLNQISDEIFYLDSGVHICSYKIIYENEQHWVTIEPDGFANVFNELDYDCWKALNISVSYMDF